MPANQIRHGCRRRGTAYVLVLSITTLLIVLGISATFIARGDLEQNQLEHDQANARVCAQYTLDYVQKLRDGDTTWRLEAPHARWISFLNIDGVSMYYAYVDPIDSDLANDSTQPFLIYSKAISGNAKRMFVVEMIPGENGRLIRNTDSFKQITADEINIPVN